MAVGEGLIRLKLLILIRFFDTVRFTLIIKKMETIKSFSIRFCHFSHVVLYFCRECFHLTIFEIEFGTFLFLSVFRIIIKLCVSSIFYRRYLIFHKCLYKNCSFNCFDIEKKLRLRVCIPSSQAK